MAPKKQQESVLTEAQQREIDESNRRKKAAIDGGVRDAASAPRCAGAEACVVVERKHAAAIASAVG